MKLGGSRSFWPAVTPLFANGANGFLLKEDPARHLLDVISYIRDGGQYLTPLISREALNDEARVGGSSLASLSRREYRDFAFLVDGMRPKDIAAIMDISPKTVDTYRCNIMRKLGFHDIVSLVKFAIEKNLLRRIKHISLPAVPVPSSSPNRSSKAFL